MHESPGKPNVPDMNQLSLGADALIRNLMRSGTEILQSAPQYGVAFNDQLKFLWGQPLNNLAWNWLHSLRPSRVTLTQNADDYPKVLWGVTVFYDVFDGVMIIRRICQVCKVGVVGVEDQKGFTLMKLTNQIIKDSHS